MSIARTSSTVGGVDRNVRIHSFLVAEAPESHVDNAPGSPARGMLIALAASVLIWAGIAALIF